jgi:1,4-dihydroxy-2-naphthoate octaprenyltransferase
MDELSNVSRTSVWLKAFRLQTLPLAFACILLGNLLAYHSANFQYLIGVLSLVTALCLQILSNLANDYGDAKNGADNEKRTGPKRMVQSGLITIRAIKNCIIIFTFLSLVSGVSLIIISVENVGYHGAMVLFLLGIFAIGAAIAYTASRKPYGYRGLGDISVFIFFGLVAVLGSYYLQSGQLHPMVILPSMAMGLLCTGVLNVNNIRDIEADTLANKRTIPVKIGLKNAKLYHWMLMLAPIALFSSYLVHYTTNYTQLIFMLPAVLFIVNGFGVSKSNTPEETNPYLKRLAIAILLFSISYGLSFVFFH